MRPFLLGTTTLANFAGTYTLNNQLIGNFKAGEIVLGRIVDQAIEITDDLGQLQIGFDGTVEVGSGVIDNFGTLQVSFDGFINEIFVNDDLGDLQIGFDGSAVFSSFAVDNLGTLQIGFDGTVFDPLDITDDLGELAIGFDGSATTAGEYYRNAIIQFNDTVYLSGDDAIEISFTPTVIKLIEE